MILKRILLLILLLAISLYIKSFTKNLTHETTLTNNNQHIALNLPPPIIPGIPVSQLLSLGKNKSSSHLKTASLEDGKTTLNSELKPGCTTLEAENDFFFENEIEEDEFIDLEEIPAPMSEPQEAYCELDTICTQEECCEQPTSNFCCSNPWITAKMITLSHIQGLNRMHAEFSEATNYSSIDLLLSYDYCPGQFLPMLDLRGHFLDDSAYAVNVGLAARYIPSNCDCFCSILGLNLFYDWRGVKTGNFEQFGIGLEVLTNRWDFRANLYIPFGTKEHHQNYIYDNYEGDYYINEKFYQNNICYAYNAEIGLYLYYDCNFSLYLAGGPYCIEGKYSGQTTGGELRIKPQYKDYFSIDFSYRYDSHFRSIWQAEFILQIPLYSIKNQNLRPCCLTDWQIYQPIERFEVSPIGSRRCFETNF